MQRFRNTNPHLANYDPREYRARRIITLRLAALAERDAAMTLAAFGFHRNRVASRGRAAKHFYANQARRQLARGH